MTNEKKFIAKYSEDTRHDMAIRGAQNHGIAQGLMMAVRMAEKRGHGDLADEIRDQARSYES